MQCKGGGAFGPSAILGLPLAPPDHCALGVVTRDHSLHVGMVFAPQNSAISPPSLAISLALAGAVHPLRSGCFSSLILGLSSSQRPERAPSQRCQPLLGPSLGPHGNDRTPSTPPRAQQMQGCCFRLSDIVAVGYMSLLPSDVLGEGDPISYHSLGCQHWRGQSQDTCLQFYLLPSAFSFHPQAPPTNPQMAYRRPSVLPLLGPL